MQTNQNALTRFFKTQSSVQGKSDLETDVTEGPEIVDRNQTESRQSTSYEQALPESRRQQSTYAIFHQ